MTIIVELDQQWRPFLRLWDESVTWYGTSNTRHYYTWSVKSTIIESQRENFESTRSKNYNAI